jgi:LmbE family N-acetylglucosaminyl deacetylase/ActR/RegA family two-component response regulator
LDLLLDFSVFFFFGTRLAIYLYDNGKRREKSVMKNKKVLLVEDDSNQAKLLSRWLIKDGNFEVKIAGDGVSGFEFVSNEHWDLIISDVNMPRMNGLDFIKHCKSALPKTPVLLITSESSMETAIKAIQNKADDLMIKPINRNEIVEKSRSLIENREAESSGIGTNVLAIGAHPDDVEIGCGGVLAKHRKNGDRVHILTLSDGKQGGETHLRRAESENAAKMIDAELFWGGLHDTQIQDGQDTISAIENIINQVNPTVVYTHTQKDSHQDHRNTFNAALVAARKVNNLYCYQSPSTTIDFRPSSFTDISNFLPKKIELISAYQTQITKCSYLASDLIEATARYWGRFAGNGRVEPFEVIRESK